MSVNSDLLSSLRSASADRLARFRALVPELLIGEPAQRSPNRLAPDADARELEWLSGEGYAVLAGAESAETCASLVDGIGRIVSAGLPAVFVYAFDSVWELGERLRARASALFGHEYVLMNDVWAWQIMPGVGRGWPPHRGTKRRLDRTAPELVNAWVALSDATAERSCMHFIPLDDDADYPDRLDHVDAPAARVRAAPVPNGTALVWNGNVLHWGGACSARAAGPRVSCSYSFCRGEMAAELSTLRAPAMDFAARLDSIALQIATYGEGQPDVRAEVLEWARATCALHARGPARIRESPP